MDNPERFHAHSVNADDDLTVPAAEFVNRPNIVALRLLRSFAAFFDMETNQLPFVRDSAGVAEIDVEELSKN